MYEIEEDKDEWGRKTPIIGNGEGMSSYGAPETEMSFPVVQ